MRMSGRVVKNPHGMTEDERRRLMAGEMNDIERRRMLNRIMSWWTPERIAEELVGRAEARGLDVVEYLKIAGNVQ